MRRAWSHFDPWKISFSAFWASSFPYPAAKRNQRTATCYPVDRAARRLADIALRPGSLPRPTRRDGSTRLHVRHKPDSHAVSPAHRLKIVMPVRRRNNGLVRRRSRAIALGEEVGFCGGSLCYSLAPGCGRGLGVLILTTVLSPSRCHFAASAWSFLTTCPEV